MKLLTGKKALIFGIANKRSIAWGVAKAFHEQGCELGFCYAFPILEKRVRPLAEKLGVDFVEMADASKDGEIDAVFAKAKAHFNEIDILIHSIAYAEREDLQGRFVNTSRKGFNIALETSVYSLLALSQRAIEIMPAGGTILTMSYYGAEKVVPRYNVMGVAKSALESTVRYLAADLGPDNIRVNALSPGPIKTLSAAGIADFRKLLKHFADNTPLRRNITINEIGQTAAWLSSDLASAISGEIMHVDGGFNILAMPGPEKVD